MMFGKRAVVGQLLLAHIPFLAHIRCVAHAWHLHGLTQRSISQLENLHRCTEELVLFPLTDSGVRTIKLGSYAESDGRTRIEANGSY